MVAKVCSRSQGQPPFGDRRRAMISSSSKIGWSDNLDDDTVMESLGRLAKVFYRITTEAMHAPDMSASPAIPPRLQLRTERLTLRPFELSDAERVVEIQSNWNVTRMLRMAP